MVILLEMVKVKTGTVRFLHWVVFFSTVTLVFTGLYIADPFWMFGQGEAYQTFVMAKIRLIHFLAATFLDIAFLLRLYIAFFSYFHKDFREVIPTPHNLKEAGKTWKYYWKLEGPQKDYRWVDPFDGMTFHLLHLVLLTQIATGFALYVSPIELAGGWWGLWADFLHWTTDWTLWLFGGLTGVRVVHHITTWIVVSGALLHIYLQVWKTIKLKRADISAIINGYKLMATEREDLR